MIDYIAAILLIAGVAFFSGAALGLLRFPDLFTRVHAASKGDTLSSFCLLVGCALYLGQSLELHDLLVSAKIILILLFISVASPTAGHVITNAALISGAQPWSKAGSEEESEDEE